MKNLLFALFIFCLFNFGTSCARLSENVMQSLKKKDNGKEILLIQEQILKMGHDSSLWSYVNMRNIALTLVTGTGTGTGIAIYVYCQKGNSLFATLNKALDEFVNAINKDQ